MRNPAAKQQAPHARVDRAPDDQLMFFTADGTPVYASDMPTCRVFRLDGGEERRYVWRANDPRDVDVASLRHQFQESEPANER